MPGRVGGGLRHDQLSAVGDEASAVAVLDFSLTKKMPKLSLKKRFRGHMVYVVTKESRFAADNGLVLTSAISTHDFAILDSGSKNCGV